MVVIKRLKELMVIGALGLMIMVLLSSCAADNTSEDKTIPEEEASATISVGADDITEDEIKQMYAEQIQEYLDNPNEFFANYDEGEHVLTCDADNDGVPEFIELGYGSSFPYTATVFKYVNGEVKKFPEEIDSVLSWADMHTPVLFYFDEDATTFTFYSWDQMLINNEDADPRMLTVYRVDPDGETHISQEGTQLYGTGADPTGENIFTTNEAAEETKDQMIEDGEVFEYPWGTEGDVPESVEAHFGETTSETIGFLNGMGIPVY